MTIRLERFPNGFTVATENIPEFKTVSMGVWIKAGCRHENENENGMAHFLEHMAFKGTNTRSALNIVEEIENVGGFLNAYTSREITNYHTRVLSDNTPLALNILSDIVLNSIFKQPEIDLERGVIIQEIGQMMDTPDDVIFEWLQEVAYPNQAMGRSILGPLDLVKSFQRDNFLQFTKNHYGSDRMVFCAAGDVDHEAICRMAEEKFSKLKPVGQADLEVATFVGGEKRVEKKLEQAHFCAAFEAPSLVNDNLFTAQIFSVIFGGGMSSRLFQEVREKRGLCYSIGSSYDSYLDTGMLTLYAGTGKEKISELVKVVGKELGRCSVDIKNNELERARSQIKSSLLMGLESSSNRCERMARNISVRGRIVPIEETIEKLQAVDVNMVKNFASEICYKNAPALTLYGQISEAPSLDEFRRSLQA